jgi:hypothetical protein
MTIELSDERIDAMRAQVLNDVNADITRRGRRGRKVIAGGVGAFALVTVIGLVGGGIGAPKADQYATSVAGAPEAARSDGDAGGAVDSLAANEDAALSRQAVGSADYAAKDIAPAPVPPGEPLTAPGEDREVITTGSATVTVKDTSDSADEFTAWVEKRGGRVDGRTESRSHDGHTSATLVVRVPSKYVSAAVAQLRGLGTVESVDLQRDDVTAEGQDLDARIKALEISVKRLEGILERAGSSSEVIEAESALSSRQQELDALKVQRRSLSDQVTLSTIDVSFVQESKPGAVAPGGFFGGLVKGWNSVIDTVNSVVTAAGVLVPWLAIAGGLGLVWWIVRRVRRRG